MSLWRCPAHGLYGGTIACPVCGIVGEWTAAEVASKTDPWFFTEADVAVEQEINRRMKGTTMPNKQTSDRVSSIAGRLQHVTADQLIGLSATAAKRMASEIRTVAASALSQDERPRGLFARLFGPPKGETK